MKKSKEEKSDSRLRSIEKNKGNFLNEKSLDTINSKSRGSVLGHGGGQARSSLLEPINDGGRFKGSKNISRVKHNFGLDS